MTIQIGIIGATGYAGQEAAAILAMHPHAQISWLASNSQAEENFSDVYPAFKPFFGNKPYDKMIALSQVDARAKETDCIFLALPHGASQQYVRRLLSEASGTPPVIIDLGSDFRFDQMDLNPVYGLSEIHRHAIKDAQLIANPGCYPTAATLAILPLLTKTRAHHFRAPIIIDAKSGMSGAGRTPSQGNLFCEVFGNAYPYKLTNHRHTGEIQQALQAFSAFDATKHAVQFTPNIIPINRGIIENIYIPMDEPISQSDLQAIYQEFYQGEPFVQILEGETLPNTVKVAHTNFCQIALRVDQRTGMVILVSAIDNLVKGAAGQAIQNMNIRFGFEETAGLVFPPTWL